MAVNNKNTCIATQNIENRNDNIFFYTWIMLLIKALSLHLFYSFCVDFVAIMPIFMQPIHTNPVIANLSAALLENQPFQMMKNRTEDLEEKNSSSIDSNREEDDSFLSVSWHEEV